MAIHRATNAIAGRTRQPQVRGTLLPICRNHTVELGAEARRHMERAQQTLDFNTGDDAIDEVAGPWVIWGAESERVKQRNWSGAHCENVAQDTPHAGRRTLMRLYSTGVVVRLHFQHDRQTMADVDCPSILTWALKDPPTGCR